MKNFTPMYILLHILFAYFSNMDTDPTNPCNNGHVRHLIEEYEKKIVDKSQGSSERRNIVQSSQKYKYNFADLRNLFENKSKMAQSCQKEKEGDITRAKQSLKRKRSNIERRNIFNDSKENEREDDSSIYYSAFEELPEE
ncbi:hypothetical protein H311_01940 [Anncaliia algerae PRA109]|nr:hypothetical protein H311_01940 [Anncaliia algerae PRA109]